MKFAHQSTGDGEKRIGRVVRVEAPMFPDPDLVFIGF